jgi:hypothetical protein
MTVTGQLCRHRHLLLAMAAAVATCFVAAADVRAQAAQAAQDDAWHLDTAFSFWALSAEGTAGARSIESDVDVGFDDIFENLNFAVMPGATLTKGDWVLGFAGMYGQLEDRKTFLDGRGGDINADLGIADFSLGYTLLRTEVGDGMPLKVTPVVGTRYTYLSLEFNPFQFVGEDRSRDWWDPYVGGQVVLGLSDTLAWRTQGTIGGFGVGSDSAWSAATFLDFRLNEKATLNVGYRAVSWDYDEDDFKWDVTFHGPWIGLTVRWF